MSSKIASLGLLMMLPFAAIGMAPGRAEDGPIRPIARGEQEGLHTNNKAVPRGRKLGMMMMGGKKSHHYGDFIGGDHEDGEDETPPPEVYYSKGKGKGKGGGMMKKNKKKGKSGGGKSGGYDDWYPTDYHPPAAMFIQTLGCYADVSATGVPCIYSHNADAQVSYLVDDTCSWQVTEDALLVVEYFEIESGFVFLTVGGVSFTSTGDGLNGSPVFAGDSILFESDMLNPADPLPGFKICLTNPM